jgi:4-amino-4-deoxy-L-arabinose transferase-like glycosyltransferase
MSLSFLINPPGTAHAGTTRSQVSAGLYALAVTGLVLLAIALRIWFWWFQARSGAVQPADPEEYYRAALHILQGGYYDDGKWLRPPLYPAFLALMLAIGGGNVSFALFGQALLAGIAVLAFVWLGHRLFTRPAAGLLSGLIAATFVPLASFSSVLFAEIQFVTLIILALAIVDRLIEQGRRRDALLAGIVLALAALTRAVALLYIPLLALLLLLLLHGNWRRRLLLVALLLAGATATIAPWAIRNALVHQRLVIIDTNGGISLWYGTVRSEADRARGEAAIFALPNLADRQSLALQMAIERIRADPQDFALRMRYKIASLFLLQSRSYAVGDVVTIDPRDQQMGLSAGENPRPLSLLADAQYVLIMLGGIAGISFTPSWRRTTPLFLWFVFGVLISAITVAHHRLRLPLVGVMIPFCAYALLCLPAAWRHGRKLLRDPRMILLLAGWLIFAAMIFSTRYIYWAFAEPHALVARTALAAGNVSIAEAAFERARIADPANSLRSLELADLLFQQGRVTEAVELYAAAAELEPRSLYAHAMHLQTNILLEQPAAATESLLAIGSYGRDNNDLYQWAWANSSIPAPARLVPGSTAAFGHYQGFAPATGDLISGRWTLGRARLRLAGNCGDLRLHVRGPLGRSLTVTAAGKQATFELTGSPQELQLPLDRPANCTIARPLVVNLSSPTSLLDLQHDPWFVGVALLEAELQ